MVTPSCHNGVWPRLCLVGIVNHIYVVPLTFFTIQPTSSLSLFGDNFGLQSRIMQLNSSLLKAADAETNPSDKPKCMACQ